MTLHGEDMYTREVYEYISTPLHLFLFFSHLPFTPIVAAFFSVLTADALKSREEVNGKEWVEGKVEEDWERWKKCSSEEEEEDKVEEEDEMWDQTWIRTHKLKHR